MRWLYLFPRRLVRNGLLRRTLVLCVVIFASYLITTNLLMVTGRQSSNIINNVPWSVTNRNKTDDFIPAYPDVHLVVTSPTPSKLPLLNDTTIETNNNGAFNLNQNETVRNELIPDGVRHGGSSVPWLKVDDRPVFVEKKISNSSSNLLPLCPERPEGLIGAMKQAVLLIPGLKESEVVKNHPDLSLGGNWKPTYCRARHKVAVILPFRDRQSHLNRLLDFLIPMLRRQLLDFRFIVTEQYGHDLFNKGRIMNAAFTLAESMGVGCVVFHDVDMFPQDDRNSYGCPDKPRHIGAFVNSLGYELWYDYLVGGVLSMRLEHYRKVNGYSNMYWAWGGEDDDMGKRLQAQKYVIERPPKEFGRFTMLKHIKRVRTAPKAIYKLLETAADRWKEDGLKNPQWKIIKITRRPLYYHLYVDVGTPPDEWRKKG